MYEFPGGFRMSLGTLPAGRETHATIGMMRTLAQRGARDLLVRETTLRVLRNYGAPPHSPLAELSAIYRFVRDDIQFRGDIRGVETLQAPRATLAAQAGDCDDKAMLIAAMALSV